MLGAGIALFGGASALDAFVVEPSWLEVTRWTVDVPGLPSELDGYVVAHVTDVHLSAPSELHRAIANVLAQVRPDLVALTGDVVDDDAHLVHLPDFVAHLRAGNSRVLATLGNWEHWGRVNLERLADTYRRAGATLLGNEACSIDRGLEVVATDDSCSGSADLARAFTNAGRSLDRARVLLTHAPGLVDERWPAPPAVLTLSGHTHGGQVRAGSSAIVVPPGSGRFVAGPYDDAAAGPLFVSRGLGTSLIPARFCCRPELPLLTLRRVEPGARGKITRVGPG